jgi:hypothetical protein
VIDLFTSTVDAAAAFERAHGDVLVEQRPTPAEVRDDSPPVGLGETWRCVDPWCDLARGWHLHRTGQTRSILSMSLVEAQQVHDVASAGPRAPIAVRVLRRLAEQGDCWIWTGSLNHKGYGQIDSGLVHRSAYGLWVGEIDPGLQVDHLCRVRACARPTHLEAVTPRVNTLRGEGRAAQQARQSHCLRGHEFTDENTRWEGTRRHCRACKRLREAVR